MSRWRWGIIAYFSISWHVGLSEAEVDASLVSRLIPPPNMFTSNPSDVYPPSVLIPAEEAAAIDWKTLTNVKLEEKERIALLPYRGSRWLEQKLRLASELPPSTKEYQSCVDNLSQATALTVYNPLPSQASDLLYFLYETVPEDEGISWQPFVRAGKNESHATSHFGWIAGQV